MILIEKEMPEYCARCPLMVVHRGEDFMPTYLCKLVWREIDGEYICKSRADFCPLKEQEAVEPYHVNTNHEQHWKCGKCNAVISLQDKFCRECGRHVLWEGR